MAHHSAVRLTAAGAAVIAVTYGLGRYSYGQFVPAFREQLGMSEAMLGLVGGLSHLGYAAGLLTAFALARSHAPLVAVSSGLMAAAGLVTVAFSTNPAVLGGGVMVAGASSGLASPTLAQLVTERLPAPRRPGAQTWINAGTSLGLILASPVAVLPLDWRTAWAAFAVVALIVAIAGSRTLGRRTAPSSPVVAPAAAAGWTRILATSLILGLTSAAYWSFGPDRVAQAGIPAAGSTLFWAMLGMAGLAGGLAGPAVSRWGLRAAVRAMWVGWIIALAVMATPILPTVLAVASAGLFGATFMGLTGALIIWAEQITPTASSRAVSASFLALAAGQALGSSLSGLLAQHRTLPTVFLIAVIAATPALRVLPPLATEDSPPQQPGPLTIGSDSNLRTEDRAPSTSG